VATTVSSNADPCPAGDGCPPQIEAAVLLNGLADAIDLESRRRVRRNKRGPDLVSLQALFEEICRQPVSPLATHGSITADVAAVGSQAPPTFSLPEPSFSTIESPAPTGTCVSTDFAIERGARPTVARISAGIRRKAAGRNQATGAPVSHRLRQAKHTEGRQRMEAEVSSAADTRTYTVRLRERREIAENTFAFLFEKPDGFTFKAGQFIELSLIQPDATDARGKTRRFSLASAPSENLLMVSTRMRDSALKNALKSSPLGTPVRIEGPSGQLTLHKDSSSPAVFIAGGIGITPFRSMLLDAIASKLAHRIFLFYSNRRPEDAPFLDELEAIERSHWSFTLISTMTQPHRSRLSWTGETSMLDNEMIERFLKNVNSPTYYIAGPPRMVQGLNTVLSRLGTKPDRIRSEVFEGY
jgi:ferredoxin-NADP reductase